MSYMNDPREMVVRPESGVTLEQDNRIEEMYHWGAMVVDLCGMPVEEYMKPMTVIGIGGGGGGETPETMYTLKFVIDGVTVAQESLKSGDPIPFSVDGNKDGRNFLGWFYGSTQYSEGALMPSKSLTLTAKYTCDVKFIFVIDGDEKEVSAYTVNYNSKPSSIPSTIMEGYTFKGWEPSVTEPVKSHTTYVGAFEIKTFTVTWNGYSEGPIVQTYNYGDALVEPEAPTKEGYSFTKWDKSLPEVVKANYVFTAQFTINQYVITFYQEWYGVKSELSAFTKNYGTTITLPKVPSEKGYTYSEWQSDYTGTTVPAYNIEYVTVKTVNSYVLAYYDMGEDEPILVKEDTYEYMETIIPYSYSKEGWTVYEWENLPEQMPYNNVSAYCQTEINFYTVTFVDQNGETYIVETEYGTPIKDIIPEIEGKTFEVSEEIYNSTVGVEDIVINGIVTVNNYKVSITIDGEKIDVTELPFGTNVEDYINENFPAEEGYSVVINSNHETVPADNSLVVNVSYEANVWILSYSTTGSDNDLNGEENVAFGTEILTILPEAEQEGYEFDGWYIDDEKIVEGYTMPNNDVYVNGTYEIKKYTVVINDDDIIFEGVYPYGTKLSSVLNEDVVINYINTESANGYTVHFVIDNEDVDDTMIITDDVVISVNKTPNEYLLIFMNGEEIISEEHVKFGEIINYPSMENKTEDGVEYVFIWEDTSYNGKTMPSMDLTIKGNYQEKSAAPIYYGSFVVLVNDYTTDNISQFYNEADLNTDYYKSGNVSDYVGNGKVITVTMPAYEPFSGLNNVQAALQTKNYYEPITMIMPVSVIEKYNVSLCDYIGSELWGDYITDNEIININGNNYYFYVKQTDSLRPNKNEQNIELTLKLTEK